MRWFDRDLKDMRIEYHYSKLEKRAERVGFIEGLLCAVVFFGAGYGLMALLDAAAKASQ